MFRHTILYNTFAYIVKCALASGFIMFVCMAAGELLVSPELFHDFLNKPKVWPFIFFESAAWMIPMAMLSLLLLWPLRKVNVSIANSVISFSWATIGIVAIVAYKIAYYPEGWSLDQVVSAHITFGWTVPCTLILVVNGVLSEQFLNFVPSKR